MKNFHQNRLQENELYSFETPPLAFRWRCRQKLTPLVNSASWDCYWYSVEVVQLNFTASEFRNVYGIWYWRYVAPPNGASSTDRQAELGFRIVNSKQILSIFHCSRVNCTFHCCSNRPEVEVAVRWRHLAEAILLLERPIPDFYSSTP